MSAPDPSTHTIGSAIERLLSRFDSLARRLARSRGLPPAEVDEILQDVRIRLWRAQPSGEKISSLGTSYFLRVVSSAVIDHLRTRQRRRETALDAVTETDTLPDALQVQAAENSERDELARRLASALEQLPQNRRLVVRLHLEGYERPEISGMTGWTEAKVRNLLYRGLDDLRALLNNDGDATS